MDEVEKCPFCESERLLDGRMSSYGGVYIDKGIRGAEVYARVCLDCGRVAYLYVKNPEKLLPKKERSGERNQ